MGTADGKGKQQKATPSTQARRTEFGLSSPAECADSKPASSHGTDTALIQATQCLTVSLPIAKSGKADSATSGSSASERDEVVVYFCTPRPGHGQGGFTNQEEGRLSGGGEDYIDRTSPPLS